MQNDHGWTPMSAAAESGDPVVLAALLANPASRPACKVQNELDWLPIHIAANDGHPAAVSQLLAAFPESAVWQARTGTGPFHKGSPLCVALRYCEDAHKLAGVARVLIPAMPAGQALTSLMAAGQAGRSLLSDFVAMCIPLSDSLWAQLPWLCPGLGRALPTALAHSPEQARRLMQHLPPADAGRLRLFALCLARAQRRTRIHLPQELTGKILSMFDS